ncbi:MAG: TolC family protein [Saprospiraceae bacterium]
MQKLKVESWEVGSPKSEVGKSEGGSRKGEVGRGKSEVRSRKGEVESPKSEGGSWKLEVRSRKSEGGSGEVERAKWGKEKRGTALGIFRLPTSDFHFPTSTFPFTPHLRWVIGLWLLCLPILGAAQSLAELLEILPQNNLELKALQQEYLAAMEKAPQVSQLPDPEIGIGAFVSPVETRLGAQRARLSATQMTPWFGTLSAREEVALANARAMKERVASSELGLSYQLKEAYFQLYELEKAQQFIRQNIGLLQSLRQLVLRQIESGKGRSVDVLRIDLKLQELEQEITVLALNQKKPLAKLNQVLNRPLATPVIVPDTLDFALLPFDKDTLRRYIRTHHPMINMFAIQQEASQKAIELNRLEGKPSLGIGVDYILVDPRSDANPAYNGKDIFQISAKLSIPLNRKKYEAKAQEENYKISALENRKADLEGFFLAKIENAYTDHEAAALRLDLYTQQIATSKAAIQILLTDYSTMGSRFDELLQLERELVEYHLKILKAIVQSHLAKANIEQFIP